MKIECVLKRPGGTVVELPGQTYHFEPQADGSHIADVTIHAHIERFLSIPEAYRLVRTSGQDDRATFEPNPTDEGDDSDVIPEGVELASSKGHPAAFVIEEKAYALADVVNRAFMDSGLTAEDWNGLDDEIRATKIDIVLDGIADGEIEIPVADGESQEGTDDRDELKAMYEAKFGKNPGRMTTVKIKAALEAAE